MRAISRFTVRSRPWLSSWPVAAWKRRLNSSSLASLSLVTRTSSGSVRRSSAVSPLAISLTNLTLNDLALHGKLVDRAHEGRTGDLFVGVGELEHHASGLDVGHPPLDRALTGAHAGLGGLLGQRAVREDVDPDLAAPLDVAGHRDTRGLDLPVGHVRALDGLDAVLTERHPGAALGQALALRVVLLAVLDLARDPHGFVSSPHPAEQPRPPERAARNSAAAASGHRCARHRLRARRRRGHGHRV